VRIGILGPLDVRDADGRSLPVGGVRLRSLLIRLAIAGGDTVPVDRLAADLWPDQGRRPPADAANAVQALVSRLRAAAGKDVVSLGPAGYRLTTRPADIDAWAFEQTVTAARARLAGGDHAAAAEAFRAALRMWRGPALADVADAPFAAATIARLSELWLAATEDRIDADLALGKGAELVPEVEELAGEHPLRERLRGQLMRALYAAGRQADALGVFEDTRELLSAQLGVDPSPALSDVHLAILRAELPVSPAPARAPARRRSNLPAQLTSFVGRDEDLERVASRLLAESRLVTLTGPGGAGKTRLAVEVGGRVADELADGVWFVPLAPVRDGVDVPQAVLTALGVWPADSVEAARLAALEPLDRLAEVLAAQSVVLVLDNCEHVLDAVAALAGRVLADAPGVRILATSREPVGLTGETLCPVPSLALPPEDADVSQVAKNPAVRLFADRAAAVRPGFRVDEGSAGPVVAICRALDGIPLAIELAAARVRALTPQQVAERLDDRFALLSVGTRGTLPRHQTLRAIVDWSWDLLDDTERAVLRRLSVFSGGATPQAAECVCAHGAPGGAAADRGAVVDIIASLIDKSLVTAAGDGHVRYGLLETVRAYAADRLAESGEADLVVATHAGYFLDLAERAEPQLRTRDQLIWLGQLSAEHDNLSTALRNVVAAGDAASALRFFRSLAWFWILRDYDAEARDWSAEVLRVAGDAAPDDLSEEYAICQIVATMTKAMNDPDGDPRQALEVLSRLTLPEEPDHPLLAMAAPMLTFIGGDAEGAYKQLRDIPEHRDPWVTATRRSMTGHLALNEGDIDSAAADLAEGIARFVELGDRFGLIGCLVGLAQVAIARGDPDEAVRALEQAREHAAALAGNMGGILGIGLGEARARAGEVDRARADLQDGVRSAERAGELDDAASGYTHLAELARRTGDLAGARDLLRSALAIVESRLQRPDMFAAAATTFSRLGCIAEQEGDLAGAALWQQRAIGVLSGGPDDHGTIVAILPINRTLAGVVDAIAALAAARGEHARAAELLGLAHALQGFSDGWSLEVARATAAARAALGDADFEAAYARGRNRDGAKAEALALRP